MKTYIKNHWKSIVIILLVILVIGLIFYYNVLPRYNQRIAQIGYNQALNDLAMNQAVPLFFTQDNETKIQTIRICIPEFQQVYEEICGL